LVIDPRQNRSWIKKTLKVNSTLDGYGLALLYAVDREVVKIFKEASVFSLSQKVEIP